MPSRSSAVSRRSAVGLLRPSSRETAASVHSGLASEKVRAIRSARPTALVPATRASDLKLCFTVEQMFRLYREDVKSGGLVFPASPDGADGIPGALQLFGGREQGMAEQNPDHVDDD